MKPYSSPPPKILKCSNKIDAKTGPIELRPVAALLSSTYMAGTAEKCIDGITNGPDKSPDGDMCHTQQEAAPWVALDFGYGIKVSVEKVVIVNRRHCCYDRTRNIEIRLSDELPINATEMFASGNLLATYPGPGGSRQHIELWSGSGWSGKYGRYLILQMNKTEDIGYLNLKEITAFGNISSPAGGDIFILSTF